VSEERWKIVTGKRARVVWTAEEFKCVWLYDQKRWSGEWGSERKRRSMCDMWALWIGDIESHNKTNNDQNKPQWIKFCPIQVMWTPILVTPLGYSDEVWLELVELSSKRCQVPKHIGCCSILEPYCESTLHPISFWKFSMMKHWGMMLRNPPVERFPRLPLCCRVVLHHNGVNVPGFAGTWVNSSCIFAPRCWEFLP